MANQERPSDADLTPALLDLDRNLRRLDHLIQSLHVDPIEAWKADAIFEALESLQAASERLWEKRKSPAE